MKRFSLSLTLCLAAFMPLHVSAQAAADAVHAAEDDGKPKADKRRLFKAGGIGCVAGGAIALLTGKKDKASHGTGCHSSRSRAVARGGGSPRGCACSSSAFRTGQARSHDRETRTCRRSPGIDDSANCAPANAFAETCNRPIAEEAPRTRRRTAERLAAKSQCRPRRLGEEVGDRLIPLAHPRIRSRKK